MDIEPLEIAKQLTLIESKLFINIKPVEFILYRGDMKVQANDLTSENVRNMIQHSNHITGWVAETLLLEKDGKKRAAKIKHFSKIADKCNLLKNFASRESM